MLWSETKRSEIEVYFFAFLAFFHFFFAFILPFCLNFVSILPSFSLQIFGVSHRSESCEVRLFFASKRNEIFASSSNFASEAKVRAHPTPIISFMNYLSIDPVEMDTAKDSVETDSFPWLTFLHSVYTCRSCWQFTIWPCHWTSGNIYVHCTYCITLYLTLKCLENVCCATI